MMDADTASKVEAASLVRDGGDAISFPGLARVGEQMARGLGELIGGRRVAEPQPVQVRTFAEWRDTATPNRTFCRLSVPPLQGQMVIAVPNMMIAQIADIVYGGTGDIVRAQERLSRSELQILEHFARSLLPLFAASWADNIAINPHFSGTITDDQASAWGDELALFVQQFQVSDGAGLAQEIAFLFPVEMLRSVMMQNENVKPRSNPVIDPVWQNKLREAAMSIRLPMRSIFARPELSAAKLLALKAGDVIPVAMPALLPITIAGRLFAHGSVGEASGQTAIRIERIEEGRRKYE